MFLAQEKSQSEYLKLIQEKEQQDSLALEELELQKKAILSESENKLQELGREAEVYRTVSSRAIWAPVLGMPVSVGTVPRIGSVCVYRDCPQRWGMCVSLGTVPGAGKACVCGDCPQNWEFVFLWELSPELGMCVSVRTVPGAGDACVYGDCSIQSASGSDKLLACGVGFMYTCSSSLMRSVHGNTFGLWILFATLSLVCSQLPMFLAGLDSAS